MRVFWKPFLNAVLTPLLLLGMITWSGEATAAEVDMTWVDNADNEAGFEIEQSIGPNGPFEWRDTVDPDVTSYTDSNLAPLTEYCYRVRAFNSAGASEYSNIDCQTTTGENGPPVADAGADQTVLLGDAVTLDGVGSTDPDGDPLTYCWDLGDGSAPQCSEIVTHAYTAVGTYTATLTVTDTGGLSATATATITVTDTSSSGSLVITNLSVASGQAYEVVPDGLQDGARVFIDRGYTFSGVPAWLQGRTYLKTANKDKLSQGNQFLRFEVNQDVMVYVVHSDNYQLKPDWLATNFVDIGEDVVIAGETFSLFEAPMPAGEVILGGNVHPSEATNNTMYSVILVGLGGGTPPEVNNPPVADAGADQTVMLGDAVTLDGVGSTDPDGDPLTYCWDLGDGSAPQCSELVTHAYTAAGTYTATLTVTDTGGLSATATATITVTEASSSGSLVITNLSVASGQAYEVVPDGLQDGARVFIDRSYTFSGVPAWLQGRTYLKTANKDKLSQGNQFLRFEVNQDVMVYVVHSDRYQLKPDWLATNFVDIGEDVVIAGETFSLFEASMPAGEVILGGNVHPSEATNNTMYSVILVGLGGGTPPEVNNPPVANAGGDQNVNIGDMVTLDGVGSTDPDGDPLTYCWDLGDGSAPQCSELVTHAYTAAGTYTATLTVTDTGGLSATATATITVTEASSSGPLVITNLSVASGQAYEVVPDGLQDGARVFIDRSYTFSGVPAWLQGRTYLKTANKDKLSQGNQFLRFEVNQDVMVYVVHSDRYQLKPDWLATNFVDIGEDVVIAGETFSLFEASMPAGEIILGGNVHPSEATNNTMYSVILVGLD